MLKTERMSKLRVIGPKTKLNDVIAKLHALGVLHIIDHKKDDKLDIGEPLERAQKIAETLVKLRAISSHLQLKKSKPKEALLSLNDISAKTENIDKHLKELLLKSKETEEKINEKQDLKKKFELLNMLYFDMDSYANFESIVCFVGYINVKADLREKLNKITTRYKLHISQNGRTRAIALFVEKNKKEETLNFLKDYSFVEVNVDNLKGLHGQPLEYLNKQKAELDSLNIEKEKIKNHMKFLENKNSRFLTDAEHYLQKESEKAEAPLRFAQTKDAFLVTGWVPRKRFEKTKQELEKITNNSIYIEEQEIEEKDRIPIKFKNTLVIKPFEFFMRLYTLPGYREFDPSFFVFLTFPLFFGFMLGDVGYGIVTMILFWYLRKKLPWGKDLLAAMMWCSGFTIFFGFIFGEYFGFEHVGEQLGSFLVNYLHLPLHKTLSLAAEHGAEAAQAVIYDFPRLILRTHGSVQFLGYTIPTVLAIGAIVGVVHVNLGLIVGFFNELHHGIKAAIFEKFSWFVLEAGVVLIALGGLEIMPQYYMYAGFGVFALSLIMLFISEGVKGIIEFPSIFTNILSYLRLGAIGLASVYLALVVNENFGLPFIQKGGIFIFIGLLIMVIGHTINVALGILGPFLHSIRLHYVEFFSKFYKGGGQPFKPFGIEKENGG